MTKGLEPAELSYNFYLDSEDGAKYIDLGQITSAVNRKLIIQGQKFYVSSVEFLANAGGAVSIQTLPDTWVTSNAWVKAHGLWKDMQFRILEDNPSVVSKWNDFKVYFDSIHAAGGVPDHLGNPSLNLIPISGQFITGAAVPLIEYVTLGEWNMSTLVLPQHDVDPATGVVEPSDEFDLHMLGDDIGGPLPAVLTSGSILKMYQDTRARVQADPIVPADFPDSWGTRISDEGSQDPQLAALVDAEGDAPPYSASNYPGADDNFNEGVMSAFCVSTSSLVEGRAQGFCAPLGLLKVDWKLLGGTALLKINLMPGEHRGFMTTEMRQ